MPVSVLVKPARFDFPQLYPDLNNLIHQFVIKQVAADRPEYIECRKLKEYKEDIDLLETIRTGIKPVISECPYQWSEHDTYKCPHCHGFTTDDYGDTDDYANIPPAIDMPDELMELWD